MPQSLGEASYALLQKSPEKINVIDMQREMQKVASRTLDDIIEKHKNYSKKYYILYTLQKDRLSPITIKQKFVMRITRPIPDYDCSLFSYDNKSSHLYFHWSIPDENTCEYLLHNKSEIPEDQKWLLSYVERFADQTLV